MDYNNSINYSSLLHLGIDILGIIILIFLLVWIINSIILYIAAKIINNNATFGKAMGATFIIPIVSFIVIRIFSFFNFIIIGYILAFILSLLIIKNQFEVGFGEALIIVILYILIIVGSIFALKNVLHYSINLQIIKNIPYSSNITNFINNFKL